MLARLEEDSDMAAARFGVLFVLLLSAATVVSACTCIPTPPGKADIKIQADLKGYDIIFRGELIAHQSGIAVFRVDEVWKGNLGKRVDVEWCDGARGDCNGFWPDDLKIGNELIVFATKGRFRVYRTNICSPTMLASDAQGVVRALGPGRIRN